MFEPMLACPVDIDNLKKYYDRKYWMEPKLDGVRCIVSKVDGKVTLTSRGNKPFTDKLPELVEMFQNIPGDFVLDGELGYYTTVGHLPLIDFNRTMRIIGSGPEVAIQKQNREYLDSGQRIGFFAFDMLYNDTDLLALNLNNWERRADLKIWHGRNAPLLPPTIFQVTPRMVHGHYDLQGMLNLYEAYVDQGGEGMMFKNPDGLYHPGKRRANTWYKLKKNETLDVIITGSIPGQGKYEDLIGAVTFVEPDSGLTGKCSGMTDDQRKAFSKEDAPEIMDVFVGKWMEIRHFGMVGATEEGYRHPQFVRLRLDRE